MLSVIHCETLNSFFSLSMPHVTSTKVGSKNSADPTKSLGINEISPLKVPGTGADRG